MVPPRVVSWASLERRLWRRDLRSSAGLAATGWWQLAELLGDHRTATAQKVMHSLAACDEVPLEAVEKHARTFRAGSTCNELVEAKRKPRRPCSSHGRVAGARARTAPRGACAKRKKRKRRRRRRSNSKRKRKPPRRNGSAERLALRLRRCDKRWRSSAKSATNAAKMPASG